MLDDGGGMAPDDLLLCLERHATSKIQSGEDLLRVGTLGFRGEALPSIAAVSRLSLRSRTRAAEAGSQVRVEGGRVLAVEEVGAPPGTLVEVRDLFFNTPARRKFLKSQATEAAHLAQAFWRLALAHPGVAMSLAVEGRPLHELAATSDSAPRVAALLGRETVAAMVAIEEREGPLGLAGLAGLPTLSRPEADQVFFYVNRRFVRDRVLQHALAQAYQGILPAGRRPVAVLELTIDPGEVDVNVHPAKIEVRFRRSQEVHDALVAALRRGLGGATRPHPRPVPAAAPPAAAGPAPASAAPRGRRLPGWRSPSRPWPGPPCQGPRSGPPRPRLRFFPVPPAPAAPRRRSRPRRLRPRRSLFGPAGELTLLGQLHGLYAICAGPAGLVIMDQHAAHERLAYEELKRGVKAGGLPGQALLSPVTLELTPREELWAQRQAPAWGRLGLGLEPFGGRAWLVRAMPAPLAGRDPGPLVRDLLSELATAGVSPATPEFLEVALRSLACRGAVKAGQRLSPEELADLVRRAASLPPPVTCPHGRPVFLSLDARELARRFKRTPEPAS